MHSFDSAAWMVNRITFTFIIANCNGSQYSEADPTMLDDAKRKTRYALAAKERHVAAEWVKKKKTYEKNEMSACKRGGSWRAVQLKM